MEDQFVNSVIKEGSLLLNLVPHLGRLSHKMLLMRYPLGQLPDFIFLRLDILHFLLQLFTKFCKLSFKNCLLGFG